MLLGVELSKPMAAWNFCACGSTRGKYTSTWCKRILNDLLCLLAELKEEVERLKSIRESESLL